jgi:hypothetical protein
MGDHGSFPPLLVFFRKVAARGSLENDEYD